MAQINFDQVFDDYNAAHQKVWQHDRSQSLGASEVFGCIRKAFFSKTGAEKDADHEESWGALRRGDLIENHHVEPAVSWFLREHTAKTRLVYGGARQRTLIDRAARLSATPDGLVTGADDDALAQYGVPSLGGAGCFLLEVKSIDPRVNLKDEKSIHHGQVQVQMGLMRQQTRFKPKYAVIIYVDASFFDEMDIFVIEWNPKVYAAAQQRAKMVFEAKAAADLMPEGKIEDTCKYCPFRRACSTATGEATPTQGQTNASDLPLAVAEEIEALIAAERALAAEEKLVSTERSEASEKLKAAFRELGVKRVQVGPFKANLIWVKGRKTLDLEAMREDGIDVDKYYIQGNGYDMLRISEAGPDHLAADDT